MSKYEEPRDKESQKVKLTLGIEKDVVERAKTAGINISALTEQLLKSMTYEPRGNTREDVVNAYWHLFEAAAPILKRYSAVVEVGYIEPDPEIIKYPGPIKLAYAENTQEIGLFLANDKVIDNQINVDEYLGCLHPTNKIISNLISTLIETAQENKDKIKELHFAERFITALCNDIEDKN